MKTNLILVTAVLMLSCGCSQNDKPKLKLHSEEVIHSDPANTSYSLKTYYTRGLIGLPVWQIIENSKDGSEMVLFTVERIWQETEPGKPILLNTSDEILFRDRAESYEFSVSTKSFIKNRWTDAVYVGDYTTNYNIQAIGQEPAD